MENIIGFSLTDIVAKLRILRMAESPEKIERASTLYG